MNKEFDNWFKEALPNTYKGVGKEKIESFVYETAEDAFKAGQESKQQEIDELKRLVSDAIKGIEIELRYATSMGHEQAVKAYQNSLDSLIQCKSFK